MKTKIRTQENEAYRGYKHMHIQILEPRYGGANYLETIGTISFQMTDGDPEGYRWYGMKFIIETDNVRHIDKMAKIAKFIMENRTDHSSQPDEIKRLIGAEEHVIFDSDFIPVSKNGFNSYKVMVEGNYYSNIIAATEMLALKELKKRNIKDGELKFDKQVSF